MEWIIMQNYENLKINKFDDQADVKKVFKIYYS